jgi:hypothetical protein
MAEVGLATYIGMVMRCNYIITIRRMTIQYVICIPVHYNIVHEADQHKILIKQFHRREF